MLHRFVTMWCLLLLCASPAWAKPQHKQSLGRYYGTFLAGSLKSCATCHVVPAGIDDVKLAELGPDHNAFGKQLSELAERLTADKQPADLATRLKRIADQDADGDGVANELEFLAGTSPADAAQKPDGSQLARAAERQREFRSLYRWEPWQRASRPAVPSTPVSAWVRNPIDAFVAADHAKHGLSPRPEAARHVLLRRAYLDLTGLPPTADELRAFLGDASADAYEQAVARLLASPRYGERWGRHWMDVWRYSDWTGWGAQVRDSKPHIWRWRDWIIEACNADKPYDRMVLEMLAADEVSPEDADALRATGFLVRNFKMLSREQWLQDTVNHTAKAFLGLTLECARCHNHMYDPISQDEYYRFRAIFEPHNVRADRIPGQVSIEKDGLARVFDADPAVATFFLVRGDERQADKQRPMTPGVPAALGGSSYAAHEVPLPLSARIPDKRPFVADDDLQAAGAAIEASQRKLAEARQKLAADGDKSPGAEAARRDVRLQELDVALAEAKRSSLAAVLRVELLEDSGRKQIDPANWETAAREAAVAQRHEAAAEKRKARFTAEDAVLKAELAKAAVDARLAAQPDDAKVKAELEKAAKAAADAQKNLTVADEALNKAEQDVAAVPTADYKKRTLTAYPEKSTGRRLALAKWIADPQNPLTARVAVNHIWTRHFGQPLVPSVFDFGNNGQPPTHPALVDWLAAEFMQPSHNVPGRPMPLPWSMKHLHWLIVTSSTYRMASTPDAASSAVDPDNRYLWRAPSRRMEAEVVRDGVLYVAGQLDLTTGGPDLDDAHGLKIKRRSLYFRHAPEKQMTFLRLFDAASPNECYCRKESIVPQQALALANSSLSLEQSRLIARQLHPRQPNGAEFIRAAFEQVLARPASEDEVETCLAFLVEQQQLLDSHAARLQIAAADLSDVTKPAVDRALRARENLVHVLLNHHDFVTIR